MRSCVWKGRSIGFFSHYKFDFSHFNVRYANIICRELVPFSASPSGISVVTAVVAGICVVVYIAVAPHCNRLSDVS